MHKINCGIAQERSLVLGYVFLCLPFFDMLNGFLVVRGFLQEGALASPSQIGRVIATLLLLLVAYRQNLRVFWVVIVGIGVLVELISGIFHGQVFGTIFGVVTVYRLAYFCLLYIVLEYYAAKDLSILAQYLKYNLVFISLSLIFSHFTGLGNSTYGWGFGTKGFFASGNGLGIYIGSGLISLLAFRHYRIYVNIGFLTYSIVFLGTMLIGSKTAMILALLFIGMTTWLSRFRILFVSIVIFVISFFSSLLIGLARITFDVIILRYQNSNSIIDFLFSGRVDYVNNAFLVFYSQDISFFRWMFGAGSYVSFQDPTKKLIYDTLETDLFDVFFMYGIFGVFLYLITFFYGVFFLRKKIYLLFIWVLLFLHSLFAGHIIFNGMSVTILALLLAIGKGIFNSYKKSHLNMFEVRRLLL